MASEVSKNIEIVDTGVLHEISGSAAVQDQAGSLSQLQRLAAQEGGNKIRVVEDRPDAGDILEAIAEIRRKDEKIALFVVSSDARPEHIVEIMKAGATEFFLWPVSLQRFHEAVEKVCRISNDPGAASNGKLYSFIGSKGGLGTTVLAVNTAVALARGGRKGAVLLDMGLQAGDSAVLLDIVPKTTILDLSKNIHRLDAGLFKKGVSRHATGVELLAAPADPGESETILPAHVKKIVELTKDLYETVVVDCPSMSLDACSVEVFLLSDKVFIVSDLSITSIRNALRLSKTLQKLGVRSNNLEILINRFVKGKINLPEIEKSMNKSIYWLFPNDFADIVSSINRGVPLVKYKPGTSFSKNIMEFCAKLTDGQVKRQYRGVKGFFGKSI